MFLGIEIGGTKLQLATGHGDGQLQQVWRATIDPAAGAQGILRQIQQGFVAIKHPALTAIGIGFGGPTDDATRSVIKSHQVPGWDNFPLAAWCEEHLQLPTMICNDADTAGLGEAMHGAGRGYSPMFYITVGSGIGGGLVIDGKIYRGAGRGATEIGHLVLAGGQTTEALASGWGIEAQLKALGKNLTARELGEAVNAGDEELIWILRNSTAALATAIQHVITLLCPRRIVIGGGVSLIGEKHFFAPLREAVTRNTFAPFAGLTEIVPAALGEEVVLHGAIELAKSLKAGA
jgi:glucokinase